VKRLALVLMLMAAAPASAARPGPRLLYAKAAVVPQLRNAGVWHARPILVSGASAYRRGEFVYQDFLYDDHGAKGTPDPSDARLAGEPFSRNNGTLTYPTDPRYAQNAADLVELRVKPLKRATAFRITLNSMTDPKLVGVSLAIGDGPLQPFPGGAGVSVRAKRFVTIHDGQVDGGGSVRVNVRRRQFDVRVPGRLTGVQRIAAGVGLWGENGYLTPGVSATATEPGGGPGPAFFNVAFRRSEPLPDITSVYDILGDPAWWRDKAQAAALASGDISAFHADVDFDTLRSRKRDDSGVPKTGALDRILPSHFETEQGVDHADGCEGEPCPGPYRGRLQPYALYVPEKPRPARGWGSTLGLHPFGTNYNIYSGSFYQSQIGGRGKGSLVITPEARGPAGGYTGYALADVFDVWNDVARRYKLDRGASVVTGYSMGGIGTFEIAELYPDLFAAAQATAGADSTGMPENLRHVPMLMWNMAVDEEVTADKWIPTAQSLDDLDYRYELDIFAPGEHNTFAVEDTWGPVADYLGVLRVPRNPAHVTFSVSRPDLDHPELGLDSANHAYWLAAITAKDPKQPAKVDAVSYGIPLGDPPATETQRGAATVDGGHFPFPVLAYTRQYKEWGKTPARPREDRLVIKATGVESLVVDAKRAGLSCGAKVDAPGVRVRLAGC
jgi:hypothetical protein